MHSIFLGISVFIAIGMFVFVLGMMFVPGLRSKFMGHQLKMQKRMLEDNKEVMQDIGKITGEIGVKTAKGVLDENEEDIRHVVGKTADISKDAITTTTRAIKKGLTEEESVYCKHCGESIDSDSTFCKVCGKKQ